MPSSTAEPVSLVMPEPQDLRSPSVKAFKRKVRASKWALLFERLWPRLWLIIGIAGLFLLVSLLGVWSMLGNVAHVALLAAFVVAGLTAILRTARVSFPTHEEAVRRIERVSGIPHRPASSYEDTITANADDPRTKALWHAHRARLAQALSRLRVGKPQPRTDRSDPIALRALLMLSVIALVGLVGDSAADRIRSAFRFDTSVALATARLDAWVTPPPYTDRPPVMLADGSLRATAKPSDANALIQVPEKSVLIVRAIGAGLINLSLEILAEGADEAVFVEAQRPESGTSTRSAGAVSELRFDLTKSARIRVLMSGTELARWTFDVIPDNAPKIAHAKDPIRTRRGSLRLNYTVEDDYGVASAEAVLKKVRKKEKSIDPSKAWARPESLKGPRLPLERPPELKLRLPRADSKEAQTYVDLGPHPWAGREVILTLEATDVAGNVGRSNPIQIILPERQFQKPLARALVEQRRKLLEDSRYRSQVLRALEALTLEPEGFIDSASIYLGLRTVYHSLRRDETREGLKSVTDGLWDLALRIENGDLSDAEKALREAQEKLADALEKGAPDAELQALMQQLRDALKDYVDQLAKDTAKNEMAPPEGLDQENQQMSQEDLQRMMKDLENQALNGSRDEAQRMLAELRDLMERLQSGQMSKNQAERGQMMMKKLDELGDIVGQQQRLMDETFRQHRRQGQRGPRAGEGTPDPNGRRGQQQGQGQPGQGRGQRQGQQAGSGLSQQQRQLKEELDRLRKELDKLGAGSPEFEDAQQAMENAERSLKEGDNGEALGEQGRALQQMRQGAQQMVEDMQKGGQKGGRSKYGQEGNQPRDPLGRPQRYQGPHAGNSVRVPDEIDMQRAREILEELRRRSAEPLRPRLELDYFDRLLRRF